MSDGMDISVGQTLREAREAQNITLDDVALRLRLMHRQVEAMETDDFQSMGPPVFARGFVRNYARLLGIQPELLLERMEGAPAEPSPVAQPEPPISSSWLTSPWLILLLLAVVVIVAVPVSLYLWLNSDAGESPQPVSSVLELRPVPAAVAPLLASNATIETPVAEPLTEVVSEPEQPVDTTTVSAVADGRVVHLEFGEESWVEVKDATGQLLHRQLNPAGSSVDILGQPPFSMVIGNAAQARMTYNGRPIDLKPFIDVTVARFTLEE